MAAKSGLDNVSWMRAAECDGVSPGLMFPDPGDLKGNQQAQAICARCAVREICAEYALSNRIPEGVWGGLTENDRRRILRRRRGS